MSDLLPDQLIDSMCMTWRHDFFLTITKEEKMFCYGICSGMTEEERDSLRQRMRQLLNHHGKAIAAVYQPATGAQVTDTIAFTRAEVMKIHDFTKPFTGRKTDSINKILEAALAQRKAE